jgi:hypothetical protein
MPRAEAILRGRRGCGDPQELPAALMADVAEPAQPTARLVRQFPYCRPRTRRSQRCPRRKPIIVGQVRYCYELHWRERPPDGRWGPSIEREPPTI